MENQIQITGIGAVIIGFIGMLMTLPAAAADAPAKRSNVIVVIADQWRAEAFGHMGNPDVKTPNIDKFQAQSIHFINAVAGTPVCCPTRASLMTGQRPLTHGVFMNDVSLSPEATSLGKCFRDGGYDTAYIGKWHMDGHGRSNFIPRERRQGFEYWKVLECTHDYNNSFYYADGPEKLKWDGYDAFAQTLDAQKFVRDHASASKPFLLFLAWGPPHDPYQSAPEKFRTMYTADKLTTRPNVPEKSKAQARKGLAGYYAHCSALDDAFGNLRNTLAETGLEQNTILIFTSDHGDLLGAHGGSNKQQPYDESIRIPLLVRWPQGLGIDAKRPDALINSEDFMPTLLGLCGLPIPKAVEGINYSDHLHGAADPSDGATLISCVAPFGQWPRKAGGKEYRGVRTKRYTYVRDLNGPWLLFDNQNDPWQQENLTGRPEFARLQADLEALLQRKLAFAKDEFLPGDKYIAKWGYKVDATGTVPYTP